MTREEVKQICQIYDNLRRERDAATIVYNSDDTFWDHILMTYNLSQPSLPDNLDEAAEEYAIRGFSSIADTYKETIAYQADKDAFKAGAKWMAGQGYKQTERVYNFNGENIPCVSPVIYLPKEFEIGDKVAVQVRKQ